jgi:5-(carboxyamino)imidazole ribonucleotide synthase
MIGGGQLSRMTHQASVALGVGFRVLAQRLNDSAAQVCADVVIGEHDDAAALKRAADGVAVVTFDHEHVPLNLLEDIIESGTAVHPGPHALQFAQDKVLMREKLTEIGSPVPAWAVVSSAAEVSAFADVNAWPVVLKVSRGGYDGRGVWVCADADEVHDVMSIELAPQVKWLVEKCVPFTRELSAQVARSPHGQMVAYPVVQTVQEDGMCSEVIAPAPNLDDARSAQAQQIAMHIADKLDVVGMLAVELFDTGSEILVNELAMRPHNSGHWSIDGAVTSQFENHLRAVLDLPLGNPAPVAKWTVMVNVIGGEYPDMYAAFKHCMARDPGLRIHMYGKEVRPGRKIGHVTVLSEDLDDALRRAHHAADYLRGTIQE